MKKVSLLVVVVVMMLTAGFGQATTPILTVNIPFEFIASGKTLPAGQYSFKLSGHGVQMTNHGSNEAVYLPLLTRIAADKMAGQGGKVSFDVRDGKHFIEALWPAGEDGYLVHTVKGQHGHDVVKTM